MTQLQKYTWLIDTIRCAGKISHRDLSDKWERCKDLSDCKPLHRATFNRWRDAIFSQFGIIIDCQRAGGYHYYIANPEEIDEDELKKWMLDSFSVGNLIGENLSLKDRIIVDQIPSGRDYLTTLLTAMKDNRVINIEYKAFKNPTGFKIPVEPYCVKLYENRWYMLGHNISKDAIRLYGLDRIESMEITEQQYKLPKDFSASEYFSNYFGIVVDDKVKPARIIIRSNADHTPYLKSLPLHHSQKLIEENGKYAEFELYLAPTYDFVMKLLQAGAMIEVVSPPHLRETMKGWISEMYDLYKND
ncbi:WYL domain-containing protein [uncultured Duncaniella sp.]|uniref:helix-turn-helix transcriptional regulator n=1 Tax=uncultured Duncaniella sp. TaxID=2768039 RepID=UPI00321FA79C